MIKPSILTIIILIGILSGCSVKQNKYGANESLNVVLITADDLNYNSVGAYGCTIPNITPIIDRLAKQGKLLNHGYVNIAVCQPSRQSIMTGRYPHRNEARGFDPIDRDVPTLQEQLRKAGCLNAIIGKEKHLKPMDKFCWDVCIKEDDVSSGSGIGRSPDLYYKYASDFFQKPAKFQTPDMNK